MVNPADNSIQDDPSPYATRAIMLAVYGMAMCSVMLLVGLYRYGIKPSLGQFLLGTSGILCMVAVLGLLLAAGVLVRFLCYSQSRNKGRRYAVITSLLIIVLVGGLSESILRVAAVQMPSGTYVGNFHLLPRQWQEDADRNRKALVRASQLQPFIVGHDTLGWTVGPNRKSEDGLYESSAEGLRSAKQGEVLRTVTRDYRIALLGDSFMFGEDVNFESSLGNQLEAALGSAFQVLNFGVEGYGVDQMYLKYEKDVRMWNPDVVILGFIDDDVNRSMMIYPFIGKPHWLMPWSKPRFVLQENGLALLNMPTVTSERIFSAASVQELPFIRHDHYYNDSDWEQSNWKLFYQSYVFRSLISLYPQYEVQRGETSSETRRAIHREIFLSFVEKVKSAGSIPLISWFPVYENFVDPSIRRHSVGASILKEAGVDYFDATSCLERVTPHDRFVRPEGGHFSQVGNEAIARCLSEIVLKSLSSQTTGLSRKRVTLRSTGVRSMRDSEVSLNGWTIFEDRLSGWLSYNSA